MNAVVIKCGGSTLQQLPDTFYKDMIDLVKQGVTPIVVHGGGPMINDLLERLNVPTTFHNGLRVTDESVLQVVEMVLSGTTNKDVVRRIQKVGGRAIGISGVDAFLLHVDPVQNHAEVGLVGEVKAVNQELLSTLIEQGLIPVISPLGTDKEGQHYNVNADTAAGAIAAALGIEKFVLVTDVPGILVEEEGEKKVLAKTDEQQIDEMIQSGVIYGGMIPKVKAALHGLQGSVKEVWITSGKLEGVLKQIWNTPSKEQALGTCIVKREKVES